MKKLGMVATFMLVGLLAISVVPANAQTASGLTTATVSAPDAVGTPAPASVTKDLNLYPSLAPKPKAAKMTEDTDHRFEVFAGYSFLNNDISAVDDGQSVQLDHGYAASVTFNLSRHFGILADFSGHNGSHTQFGVDQDHDQYYFLFGPVVSHAFGKARVSGHVLVGVARQRYSDNFSGEFTDFGKETNFSAGVGGAFDWMFSDRWGWRVLQFDYLTSVFDGLRLNNVRGETGIIVRFK